VWGVAAACGLAELLSQSAAVQEVLLVAGALYLVALGGWPLVTSLRRCGRAGPAPGWGPPATGPGRTARSAFSMGLGSDLLNPKVGLFYLTVMPLFIPPGEPVLRTALLLCAVDVVVALAWLLGLSWAAGRAVGWLGRPRVASWSGHLLSGCLVGLGVLVAIGR
jgi:threonine/homoserine/homoserine lactone efflux protein